jgi:branched-chain amino acid transport system ATP-binding protein
MTAPLLEIRRLTSGYGSHSVLKGLSASVRPGERIALVGPNGCGKSTLLRAMMAEVSVTEGTIHFRGEEITQWGTDRIARNGIAYLRQKRNIFPGLTVREHLELALILGRCEPSRRATMLDLIPTLGGLEKVRAGLLSGGQRQALAFTLAMMRPAPLVLLDEPVAGLAQAGAVRLLDGLDRLQRSEGFALLIVEHRLRLVQPLVGRVVVMVQGRIVEDTTDTGILLDRDRLESLYLL